MTSSRWRCTSGRIEAATPLLVVTLRDRTELEEGRTARFEAEAKYRALVEHIPAVVYLDPVDENAESIYVSPQVVELLGISQDEWLTDPYAWRHHVHAEDIDRAWDTYRHAYNAHEPLNHEYRMVHEDGTVRWVLEQAYPIDDEGGDPWLIQGVIFDITERKRAEEQVAFLAYHDKLTGLPNRALFEEMLETAIARARRHDLGVGVLYLDLDNFKLVNDSLGHHAGDELLKQLAERLSGCTRETDLVARQGGDEFLLLLADLERGMGPVEGTEAGMFVAESVATRVHEALQEPFDLERRGVLRVRLDRREPVPSGRRRRDEPPAERRLRDVSVEEGRAGRLHRVRERRGRRDRAPLADHAPPPRGGTEGLGAPLAAGGRARRRHGLRRRSADPVAQAQRRDHPARGVHPRRGRARAHRGDR